MKKEDLKQLNKDMLEKVIETLPSNEREVVRLRYLEGCKFNKISNMINYSKSSIYRFHSSARKKILSALRSGSNEQY